MKRIVRTQVSRARVPAGVIRSTLVLFGAWGCLSMACSCRAGLIVEETFDYALGDSLVNQTDGTGWSGVWRTQDMSLVTQIVPGLVFNGVAGNGQALKITQNGSKADHAVSRALGVSAAAGETLWASYLFSGTNGGNQDVFETRLNSAQFGNYNSASYRCLAKRYSSTRGSVGYDNSEPTLSAGLNPARPAGIMPRRLEDNMRKKIVAGNWKMNKTVSEAMELAAGIKKELADYHDVDVVLCPPFTALKSVGEVIGKTAIRLGAQNMHWEVSGAYTGEVSPRMLREDLYCHYVILGHSERRTYFGETDAIVNRKVKSALANNLIPIVCVGETLEQRDAGRTESVVGEQIRGSLAGLDADAIRKTVIAYEPVWAIGTGRTATPEQAQDVHAFIRRCLAELSDDATAQSVRIQYGGSMKASNAAELMAKPDIDGGLIGGAALEAKSFVEIVRAGGR